VAVKITETDTGGVFVDHDVSIFEQMHPGYIISLFDEPVELATNALAYAYEVPAGAIVGVASVTITAEPAGHTNIGNVARVRAAQGAAASTTDLVVDFGGLRTVSSLAASQSVTELRPWTGTAFSTQVDLGSGTGSVSFTEVATERLFVKLATAVTPEALAANGEVTMHDPPADVELLVGGERAFFAAGPVRTEGARLVQTVDITAAVQRSVDAGTVPVALELRSSVAGRLTITPAPGAHVLAHHVEFPEGERRTLSSPDEGVFEVHAPLGGGTSTTDPGTWQIRRLRFDLQGTVGERRVIPAEGPAVAEGAELVVDPDRPIVVRIPPSTRRSLKTIDAVRLLIRAEAPTELSGHLAVEAIDPSGQSGPGEPIADAEVVATTVEVSASAAWHTLPLSRPAAVDPEEGVWAVLHAARGAAVLPLAAPAGDADDDALVRRQGANGHYRPLPTVAGVHTTALPLRVGGTPPPTAPIPALSLMIPGMTNEPLDVTPGVTPQFFELIFEPAVTASSKAIVEDELIVRLVVTGPGDHTIGPIVVGYQEEM
jgi:hypothetical protein